MISLSNPDEDFKPIDVNSLQVFDGEIINKTGETPPDFERFKMLFEKPKFGKESGYAFQAVYHESRKQEEILFKPLIERPPEKKKQEGQKGGTEPGAGAETDEIEENLEPEESPEEKGYLAGFQKGYDEGLIQGEVKGHEQGFKKGEVEGFEKGEQEGALKGHEKGYEEGLRQGEMKGEDEARQKASGMLATLEESLRMADQTLDALVDIYEDRIILLIQQIAKKAIMTELKINDGIVRALVLDALKKLVNPENIILSISEEDYDYIEMVKEEFFLEVESLKSIAVKSDPSVKRGGCRIETRSASIASDPESRIDALCEAMAKAGGA